MKKTLIALALMISPCALKAFDALLEGKAACYYPVDSTTRDIMGIGPLFSLEGSFRAYRGLYPWLSIGLMPNSGHSIGEHHETTVYWMPIGVGLKYLFTIDRFNPYFGGGILPAYLHTHDKSPTVQRVRHFWGVGGVLKAGCLINASRFFFDLFFEYTILRIGGSSTAKTLGRTANLDGIASGGGFGYRF
jgi:hypothetical protein